MTLIELIVVIGVILALASLALLISPRLSEDQRSVRSADLVSGWLLMAKQRSYRDQQSRGVRLLRDPNNPNEVRELQFVERPEDYRVGPNSYLQSPSPVPSPAPPGAAVFVHFKDLTNGNPPIVTNEPIVEQGDFLVFDTLENIPYNSHHIYSVTYFAKGTVPGNPNAEGSHIVLSTLDTPPYYSRVNSGVPILVKSNEFRFVRKARPLAGEPNLQMPRDMMIDLDATLQGGTILPGAQVVPQDLDILFSPRGQVIGRNGLGGKVILRLRNNTRGSADGDQLFVVVYTRSGLITTHPVDLTDANADGVLDSPYRFVRDGNNSGL